MDTIILKEKLSSLCGELQERVEELAQYVIQLLNEIAEQKHTEEEFRETKEHLENIIANSLDCIIVSDQRGYITRANKYCFKLLHYEKEEVIGRHISEFYPPEPGVYESTTGKLVQIDEEFLKETVIRRSRLLKEGKVSNWKSYLVSKDNKIIPVELNTVYLYNESGSITGAVSSCRDITKLKLAEERMMKLNECFLSYEDDPIKNINRLVGLCGELLEANCALYNHLDGGMLITCGQWKAPDTYNPRDNPDGHICYDVIKRGNDDIFIIRNLRESSYARTDPNVLLFNLQTYIGIAVKCRGEYVGSLCAVYQRDFDPDEEEKKLMGILASAIGIEEERKEARGKLLAYQQQLRSLASELTVTEERERRRIATDLHDQIGQNLALAKIKLDALREATSSIDLSGPVDNIRELIEQTIQDSRSLTFDLCPTVVYELGFEKALEWLTEEIQIKHGILTHFDTDGHSRHLNDDIRILLFRTIRELFMNIIKHARARNITVSVKSDDDKLCIHVEDDGIGLDANQRNQINHWENTRGFGLFSIYERLHYLDGHVTIESEPCRGTRVSITVPLRNEKAGRTN